jgi:hypothetical protein
LQSTRVEAWNQKWLSEILAGLDAQLADLKQVPYLSEAQLSSIKRKCLPCGFVIKKI